MKPATFTQRELMLWRLAEGLLGGWAVLVMGIGGIVSGYLALAYALFVGEWSNLSRFDAFVAVSGAFSAAVLIGGALMIAVVCNAAHTYPLLKLAPNTQGLLRALMVRSGVIMIIASVPAIVLRAHLTTTLHANQITQFSLHDIAGVTYLKVALYLVAVAISIFITFGLLGAAVRFAALPVMYGAMPFSSSGWSWLPFYVCAGMVGLKWLTQFTAQRHALPRHPLNAAQSPGKLRASLKSAGDLWQRWDARQLRRAARAHDTDDGAVKRVSALLAPRHHNGLQSAAALLATIFIAVMPGLMNGAAVAWPFTFLIAIAFLTSPPMLLSRIWLLPLGAARERMGHILASVWIRSIRTRLMICVVLAICLKGLWWCFGGWGHANPMFGESNSVRFLWGPLAQVLALHGVITSACLLVTAWPRTLQWAMRSAVTLFVTAVLLGALAFALKWLINETMPSTAGRDAALVMFVAVNGLLLPLIAWLIHFALRRTWKTANLAALSAAMQRQDERQQRTFAVQSSRLYAVQYPDGSIRHERL